LIEKQRRGTIINITPREKEQTKRMDKKSVNKLELSGNLVKDAVVKVFPDGGVLFNFRMAVNRKYKGRDGVEKKDAMFINATAYPQKGKEAELEDLLKKGAGVIVRGVLACRTSEWEGQKREFFEIRAFEVEPLKAREAGEKAA